MTTTTDPSSRTPVLGCIADDVTGATDLAINLVQGGMRVVQLLGVPGADLLNRCRDVDAYVVALKSRSIPEQQAIEQSVDALRVLKNSGVTRFYFKYCSTFDSTENGNIGPVAEALMDCLGVKQTIFCPAFPQAARTVYRGHLFVADKLLHESGMENHPLNPMTDANLLRVLSKQVAGKVGLLPYDTVADRTSVQDLQQTSPYPAIDRRLEELATEGVSLVITDACNNDHLGAIAHAVATRPLVTGGSGLARFLPRAYREIGLLRSVEFVPRLPQVSGRSLIVAGSCSAATGRQVKWMQQKCPAWQVDVAAVIADRDTELAKIRAWAAGADQNQPLLVASTAPPQNVADLQNRFGGEAVAAAIEDFLASVTTMLVQEAGIRRLVLAGGETSGAIVGALGIGWLHIGPEICAGVPWTETGEGSSRLALALKSGNFGEDDFFEKALEMLP